MATQSLTCLDLILQVEAAGSGGVDWQEIKLQPSQLAVVPGRALDTFTGGAVKARACRVAPMVRTSLDDSADACCTGVGASTMHHIFSAHLC